MLQTIDDEALLMDTDTRLFYELNESAVLLWGFMKKHNNFTQVVDDMLEHFNVPKEQLLTDLNLFVTELVEQKMIKVDD